MITYEDFLKNPEDISNCDEYKQLIYNDPKNNFQAKLTYNYLFGWGCSIYFPSKPYLALFIEDEENRFENDSADKVIMYLNKSVPYIEELSLNISPKLYKELSLNSFIKTSNRLYEYISPDEHYSIKINYNGKDYCELSVFFGKPCDRGINAFFEGTSITEVINFFNLHFNIIEKIYEKIQ